MTSDRSLPTPAPAGTKVLTLAVAGSFLIMLGARWMLIDSLAVNMPFWDQWGAEGGMLYVPWATGTLDSAVLFSGHGEHRILTTRLLGVALFDWNGVWNTRLQMTVAAGIHAAAIALLCFFLGRGLALRSRIAMQAGGAVFVAFPFAWENSLAAFQVQFYLVLLFQVPALFLLLRSRPWTGAWLAALPLVLLAFLSLSVGFLPAAVAAGVALLEAARKRRLAAAEGAAAIGLIAMAGFAVAITPVFAAHGSLRAPSVADGVISMARGLAWPWPSLPLLSLLIHAPWAIVAVRYLKNLDLPDPRGRVRVGFGVWLVVQAGIVAYGRGAGGVAPASRHLDLIALGLLVNLACLLSLRETWRGPALRLLSAGWTIAVITGAVWLAPGIWQDASDRHQATRIQAETVRAFLTTGDERLILDADPFTIPVPVRLKGPLLRTLSTPDYIAILPRWLQEPVGTASRGDGWTRPDGRLSPAGEWLLGRAPGVAILGVALLCGAAVFTADRRDWAKPGLPRP